MRLIEQILGIFPQTESNSIRKERREKVTRLILEDRKTACEELKKYYCDCSQYNRYDDKTTPCNDCSDCKKINSVLRETTKLVDIGSKSVVLREK